jgi:hypothetical protein
VLPTTLGQTALSHAIAASGLFIFRKVFPRKFPARSMSSERSTRSEEKISRWSKSVNNAEENSEEL